MHGRSVTLRNHNTPVCSRDGNADHDRLTAQHLAPTTHYQAGVEGLSSEGRCTRDAVQSIGSIQHSQQKGRPRSLYQQALLFLMHHMLPRARCARHAVSFCGKPAQCGLNSVQVKEQTKCNFAHMQSHTVNTILDDLHLQEWVVSRATWASIHKSCSEKVCNLACSASSNCCHFLGKGPANDFAVSSCTNKHLLHL